MKSFCVITKKYVRELREVFSTEEDGSAPYHIQGAGYIFEIYANHLNVEALAELMERMILDNNPVVRSVDGLYDRMRQLVFNEDHNEIAQDLQKMTEQGRGIHFDGYVQFRLKKYESRINDILYAVVKRSLVGIESV